MRAKSNSPAPAQRQVQAGRQEAISYQFSYSRASTGKFSFRPDYSRASAFKEHEEFTLALVISISGPIDLTSQWHGYLLGPRGHRYADGGRLCRHVGYRQRPVEHNERPNRHSGDLGFRG